MRSAPRALVPPAVARAALVLAALAAAALAAALAPASVAAASAGSVPKEVRDYVTQGALAAALDDVYGTDAAGGGIPFDDTTTPGPISRIFTWTQQRLAGDLEAAPTQLANEWATPISLGAQPVGLATIWINPDSDAPELAVFDADPDAAVALAAVPDDARLVHDEATDAWFAIVGEQATPLVSGASGVTSPTPVDSLSLSAAVPDASAAPGDPNSGLGIAVAVAVVLLGVVVVALLLPGRRRRTVEEPSAEDSPRRV